MTNLPTTADRAPAPAAGGYCPFYRALEGFARAGDLLTNDAIEDVLEHFPSTKSEIESITAEGRQLTHAEIGERLQMPADFVALLFASFATGVPLGVRAETIH